MAVKRLSSEQRTSAYANGSDFCRIFKEEMENLYQLSLLLTADPEKAEQCFIAGLDDCAAGNQVFKEWARGWARRSIIKNAIRLITPQPAYANGVSNARISNDATSRPLLEMPAEISALLGLSSFERFAFILSALEGYSDHDSALLLGCTRQTLVGARVRAMQELARLAAIQGGRQADVVKNQESPIELNFPAHLAIPA